MPTRKLEKPTALSRVLSAPKVYLDTAHLINISKLRNEQFLPGPAANFEDAYRKIDKLIRERHFGLIFFPAAALDWVDGKATIDSALEIADVVDSATLQYELEMDQFVYLREIMLDIGRLRPDLEFPDYDVLFVRRVGATHRRALSVFVNTFPCYFDDNELPNSVLAMPIEIEVGSAREQVQHAMEFKQRKPSTYERRVHGDNAAFIQDLATFRNRQRKTISTNDRVSWMKIFLRVDRILTALDPDIDVDQLLKAVDFNNCPATDLFLNARDQRLRAGHPPEENDVDDWMYLPVVPYADAILSERRLTHFIRQAKPEFANRITHDPNEFLKRLQDWILPCPSDSTN